MNGLPDDMTTDRSVLMRLLQAAAAPAEGPVAGEEAALAAFRAHNARPRHRSAGRRSMIRTLTTSKVAAVALAGGLSLVGGVAAAATGTLPGAAQDTARDMLGHVGVTVPGTDDHAGTHADTRGGSTHPAAADPAATPTHPSGAGKGSTISELATTTDATGVDKGALISGTASGGKSHAGRHGATTAPTAAPTSGAGDQASEDDNTTADQESDGRAPSGADNSGR